ncbi:Ger(x)C family spore germination protein [Paenibacillus glycanilyticus]|uniref:Ger(x)C family spore germination protein n=1 Tax=Paenibacillus glycanilyticus TaxID=126569 RepID=UPI00203F9AF3|nr:Ger(x)C family spore germination protein [Paenibacillus glycanilyticus]MCM3626662.1 Ger(x)C family spore germination protein [Paenibacillus glycanilyticus]
MRSLKLVFMLLMVMVVITQSGCWSSNEIEDLAIYAGMALDEGEISTTEREFEEKGGAYSKQNKITATVQIVPLKAGSKGEVMGKTSPYTNITGAGDSILEIFRQFSLRMNKPIIGHHLKIIVISSQLLQHRSIKQITDFMLRDNDIRPSVKIFLSSEKAMQTLTTKTPDEVPSFYINDIVQNQFRTSKIMDPVLMTDLDALMHSKQSFILQNIIRAKKQIEFSGAGIIKGDSGKWIGTLTQEDVECINWLTNAGSSGVIKTKNEQDETMSYEIKEMKTRVRVNRGGDDRLVFQVRIEGKGRISEDWSVEDNPASDAYQTKAEKLFREKLTSMMEHLLSAMQSRYKVDVAMFGEAVRIQKPHIWKEVKANWDDTFSKSRINLNIDLQITEFGSTTK